MQRLWPTAGDIGTVSVLLAEDAIVSRRKITAVLTGEADASVVREALGPGANDDNPHGSSPKELGQRLNRHVQTIRAKV